MKYNDLHYKKVTITSTSCQKFVIEKNSNGKEIVRLNVRGANVC